jgi:hypothetical protein
MRIDSESTLSGDREVFSGFGSSKGSRQAFKVKSMQASALEFTDTANYEPVDSAADVHMPSSISRPRRLVTPKPVSSQTKSERFQVLQKWSGKVTQVNDSAEELIAELADKTTPSNPIEVVTISFEDLSFSDLARVRAGALFTWSIGYEYRGATKKKSSAIHFSRLQTFNRSDREAAKKKAQSFLELIRANR